MITFATDWTTAWLMTGIGIGVVFVILVILVLILNIFQNLAKDNSNPAKQTAPAAAAPKAAQPVANASAAEQAAVATALYLYFRDVHDTESGVITIKPTANTAWHAVLNTRL